MESLKCANYTSSKMKLSSIDQRLWWYLENYEFVSTSLDGFRFRRSTSIKQQASSGRVSSRENARILR